jgi:hypothetical protein
MMSPRSGTETEASWAEYEAGLQGQITRILAMPETIIANIPQERADTVLEVALIHDGEMEPRVELRSLIWGTGLGWYRRQTLTMDGATARDLIRSLSQARRRMGGVSEFGCKVIPFPRPSASQALAEPQAMQR